MKKIILLIFAVFMLQLPIAPATFAAGERLTTSETMYNNAIPLVSNNITYSLQFSAAGDLQLWNNRTRTMLWNTKTSDLRISQLRIDQYSGKLKLMDAYNTPYWTSDNSAWANAWYGQGNVPVNLVGDLLIVQNDGNLVLYNTKNVGIGWYPVWASNTGGQ
ncbi:hypothetical protein GCM10010912_40210 [Paenibacillus albidus]|uniref:Bulb-type lectin domain-containing protein n=1 Tax=Paenibacillus albidus TaxID=2041023 RepID=A0A917CKB2_9BACL|nr:hypothetical protein [Paenibacillus albidus]GGF91102.1 hypothetical protein GCM10010912_40210 [Paenibacillus albidus]